MCDTVPSVLVPLCWPRSMSPYGVTRPQWLNSSPPSDAYMRHWTGTALVQVMACRLFGAKPLPEPMLTYCQLDPKKQTSVKFESQYKIFHSWKCIWRYRLRNVGYFVQGEMTWCDTLCGISCHMVIWSGSHKPQVHLATRITLWADVRAWHILPPNSLGQIKLSIGQADFGNIFLCVQSNPISKMKRSVSCK